MAGRSRIAVGAGVLLFGLTIASSVQLSSAASGPTTRVTETAAPVAESAAGTVVSMQLDARVDALGAELDSIDVRLSEISAALSTLTELVRMSDPDIRRARQELTQLADDAKEAALPSSLAATASDETAWALIQPLQTVNSAMQMKDSYVAALFRALTAAQRQEVSLGAFADTVRLVRSELELRMNELAQLQSDATLAIGDGEDGASSPLESVRLAIARTQELLSVAERADVDLRMLSIRLATRRDGLLDQLKRADASGEVLQSAMATVEAFVGNTFPGLPLSWATAVVGGVLHVCPVDQPHSYTDDFGAPRWAGGYHPHQGNDIFAPEGTPIRAPFDGLAVQTPNTLGGLAVTVYGEAGYVYNAHLLEYGILGRVTTGTIIGYVGNSGDAINSATHDHFEWHPGNGEAVDPFPYLNAVCLLPSETTNEMAA
jgi:murein DD-endopeptidase MepM/ murein hydrolase activator NlpD